jgi:hypothetical protein
MGQSFRPSIGGEQQLRTIHVDPEYGARVVKRLGTWVLLNP